MSTAAQTDAASSPGHRRRTGHGVVRGPRRRPSTPPLDVRAHRRRATPTSPTGSTTPTGRLGAAPAAARPRARHRPRHGPRAPIISALGRHRRARCRRSVGLCTDDAVNGAPVLRHGLRRRAVRPRHAQAAERSTRRAAPARRPASRSSTCWPRIHAVDLDAVGLGDLGRKEGYIERQLKRWYGAVGAVEDPRAARRRRGARPRSPTRIPEQGPAAHRPRRLPARQLPGRATTGDVAAVLDWELCTLGDPLADLGLLLVYWTDPERRDGRPCRTRHRARRASPRRAELVERYAAASRPRRRRTSTTTWRSATGSWPASSRASTPATAAGAMGERTASATSVFADQVELPGRARPPRRRRRAWRAGPMTDLYELIERPDARRPGAGRRPRGLDRRRHVAGRAAEPLVRPARHRDRGPLRHRRR